MAKWNRVRLLVGRGKPKRYRVKWGWRKVSPAIRTREAWGANPPRRSPSHDNWEKVTVCVHHTAGPSPKRNTLKSADAAVRATQAMHQNANGWDDVGYNFLIANGVIFEGRGKGIVGAGAATARQSWNRGYCHIAFLGDYRYKKLAARDKAAYLDLLDILKADGVTVKGVVAHGDLMPTACPGAGVRQALGL